MEDFNKYMEEFKNYSLVDKKKVALEQLKIIVGLTNTLCSELGVNNEPLITKDIIEAHENIESEDDFVEGIVVYTNSIQRSLCDFIDEMTNILEKQGK